jgi:hypothetical protein
MKPLLKLLGSVLVCTFLFGCAHPINMKPDLTNIDNKNTQRNSAKVGYYISEANLALEVTTPGGGGDKVRYFPYRDIEAGIYKALSEVFSSVSKVKNPKDLTELGKSEIAFLFAPEISTTSSSPSPFTWPPTQFGVSITTMVTDARGNSVEKLSVTGNGAAEFAEFKSNFSLSAVRASNDTLAKLAKVVRESPELRGAATTSMGQAASSALAAAPLARTALVGVWAGKFMCGPFLGVGSANNPNGFQTDIKMDVASNGIVTLTRGDKSFSEQVAGNLGSDLTLRLEGNGTYTDTARPGWISRYAGEFTPVDAGYVFRGIGQIMSGARVASRDCTISALKTGS